MAGLVGTYRLHVGLRSQQQPLPGSPFKLSVCPGPASAQATPIPSVLPLHGVVGHDECQGVRLTLPVFDKMGNRCRGHGNGGAKVICAVGQVSSESVNVTTTDNGDGTYELLWRSKQSGVHEAHVTIDGEPCRGSPFPIRLMSDEPALSKTAVVGAGLSRTKAGCQSVIKLQLLDQHSNVASPGPSLKFGLSAVSAGDKDELGKWKTQPTDDYAGQWVDDEFVMTYVPHFAGDVNLFLWCEVDGGRSLVPGSPFRTFCTAGAASPAGCTIDGFSKEELVLDKGAGKKGPEQQKASSRGAGTVCESRAVGTCVGAGETMVFRPSIRDEFGNAAAAPEGSLCIVVVSPDEIETSLEPTTLVKNGLTSYEARYEPRAQVRRTFVTWALIKMNPNVRGLLRQGEYEVRITISGVPIHGSPLPFTVHAGMPDVQRSRFALPEPPLYAQFQVRLLHDLAPCHVRCLL